MTDDTRPIEAFSSGPVWDEETPAVVEEPDEGDVDTSEDEDLGDEPSPEPTEDRPSGPTAS